MKKFYSLKSMLLGAVLTMGSSVLWGQASVNSSLYEETFASYGSSSTTFAASTMSAYDKSGSTTLVPGDKANLSFAGANAMYSIATAANMTAGNVWLNKNTTGYLEIGGISAYNAKKIKISFSQAGSGSIDVYSGGTKIGTSTAAAATYVTPEFEIADNTTPLVIKFQRQSNNTNLRIDNINVIVTEIEIACTAPTISTEPSNITVTEPATASFSVSAVGDNLTYVWQKSINNGADWADITTGDGTGIDTDTYTTPSTTEAMTGYQYRVVVNSGSCSTISSFATLTVSSTLSVGDVKTIKNILVKNTVVANELIFGTAGKVSIINMNGQVVKTAEVAENSRLDVSALPKGTYVVTGLVNGQAVSQKVIKK
jgi:hypothetical protein